MGGSVIYLELGQREKGRGISEGVEVLGFIDSYYILNF